MKKINVIIYTAIILAIVSIAVSGCNDPITDFGFDGSFSGEILDQTSGNNIPGDITSGSFVVNALGEHDQVSMVMRVKGDGTFANSKLYPQSYQVWVEGPFIESPTERVNIDLTGGKEVIHNFEVTPFMNISPPALNGTPTSSEITVNYSVSGNSGHVAELRELYCSTVSYPTGSTGSGPGWHTITVTLPADQGLETISSLEPGTRYFIRVGAKASGENEFNYSEQIVVTTP